MLSHYTTYLANRLCGGSSRKLIAGWWYSILGMTAALMLMSFGVLGRRTPAEAFASFWSAILLCFLSVGGTMIMRKFHNSMAVGFFMGTVVSMSQMFFMLFLVYVGYAKDQSAHHLSSKEEKLMALLALIQCVLLGSFAAILAAHRSEILDKPGGAVMDMMDELHGIGKHAPKPAAAAAVAAATGTKQQQQGVGAAGVGRSSKSAISNTPNAKSKSGRGSASAAATATVESSPDLTHDDSFYDPPKPRR